MRKWELVAEVVIVESPGEAGVLVSDAIVSTVQGKPDMVLGLATGSSPQVVYSELANRVRDQRIDLSQMRCFALDEYFGLPPSHPASYHETIQQGIVGPLGLNPSRVVIPDGNLDNAHHTGEDFEAKLLEAGGVDIQILGIGSNGHVGFNEPGSSLASLTRVKTLAQRTRADNARFFDTPDDVPTHCVTQGIGTILRARKIVLLAFGESKAKAVAQAVEGPVSSLCPASAIQLHPRVTVFVDEAAASELSQADYYRWAWNNKPIWQSL